MLIAALFVGALTAYYFGLKWAAYAAAATALLCVAATFMPRWSLPIYGAIAVGIVAIFIIGPRRKRPADAVLAVRWLRHKVGGVRSMFGSDEKKENGKRGH